MVAHVRLKFSEARLKSDRNATLLSMLEGAQWSKTGDRLIYIEGIRKLNSKQGVPNPFQGSLAYGDPIEIDKFMCKAFKASVESILPELIRTSRLPCGFKLLVIEEFFKFYAVVPASLGAGTYGNFRLYVSILGNGQIRLNIPKWFSSTESKRIFSNLSDARLLFLDTSTDAKFNSSSRNAPINLIKRILASQYFRGSFKRLLLAAVLPTVKNLSKAQLAKLNERKVDGAEDIISKRFYFNSDFADNAQYAQFKKNLIFTYFLVVHSICEFERAPIATRFDSATLNLVMNLHNDEFDLSDIPLPRIDARYIKSFIKDFYNSSSKIETSHRTSH